MRRILRRAPWAAGALLAVAALVLLLSSPPSRSDTDDGPSRGAVASPLIATVSLGAPPATGGALIRPSFVGLSIEYWAFGRDLGLGGRPDPLLARLLRGLASGGAPVGLRIGGRSSDESLWNPARRARPPGVTYDLTPAWLSRTRTLLKATGSRVQLGLNLELGRPAAATDWARAAARALPPSSLAGFELGNEPDLFSSIAYYGTPGGRAPDGRARLVRHYARPAGYSLAGYTAEFGQDAAAIRRAVPRARLTGPGLATTRWMPQLPSFLASDGGLLSAVTLHSYPLRACLRPRVQATVATLLKPAYSNGVAATVAPYVAQARAHGLPFSMTEVNSVACKGRRGVSDTFASGLWALRTMFELARVGVSSVYFHTRPDAFYTPYRLVRSGGVWRAHVAPLFYALRLFGQVAPAGARISELPVESSAKVSAWTLRAPDGTQRVVILNEDQRGRGVVRVRVPGRATTATLTRFDARGLHSRAAPTLAGQSYGTDGRLHGRRLRDRLHRSGGSFAVVFRRPGAAVLTIGPA
jgi:hypothetical protein